MSVLTLVPPAQSKPEDGVVSGDDVLQRATGQNLGPVIVIGRTEDGGMFFATNADHPPDVLWALETAKRALMEGRLYGD